jgi:hypothetical protein
MLLTGGFIELFGDFFLVFGVYGVSAGHRVCGQASLAGKGLLAILKGACN